MDAPDGEAVDRYERIWSWSDKGERTEVASIQLRNSAGWLPLRACLPAVA
jgi:hypothetical protein